jgi:hypothetical protein
MPEVPGFLFGGESMRVVDIDSPLSFFSSNPMDAIVLPLELVIAFIKRNKTTATFPLSAI